MTIGKIERVSLRDVWKHEARDFNRWIQENIDVLNDVIDLNLVNPECEHSAGAFSVDLVAEDEGGNPVIIENQLEKSNHDHLGKIITYLVAVDAKAAIWIVSDPRPEHVNAISWLNESSSTSFYLLKVEAIKIGESAPAPLLTLIVGPSEEGKEVGKTKKQFAERHQIYHNFWSQLLEMSRSKTKLHKNISPSYYHWIGTTAGKPGLSYNYTARKNEVIVELYIDRGKDRDDENKKIFDELYENKVEIETKFADELDWQRLENKRACRICKTIEKGGYHDEEKWQEIFEEMIDTMIRLDNALRPHIMKLNI